MNAGQYIYSLIQNNTCTKYKSEVQSNNITQCSTFKTQIVIPAAANWKRFQTKVTDTPTEVCEPTSYKEILLPKVNPSATDEYTNTETPTSICQTKNYREIIRKVNCNTMNN